MSVEKKVPELRFEGFSGEWKEKLLFEVAEKISVGIATSSSKHFVSFSTGVPFIKNQDIKNGVIDTKNLEAISNEFDNANKNKRLKAGDILTVRTGYPGLSAVLPRSLNNAQSFTTLITRINNKKANPFFISTYINSDSGKRQMNGMQAGGAQQNINANTLKNFAIYYPGLLEEQTKIGNTFQKLDSLINQHQQKHDKLSNIKKAMLEKMFPKQGETIPEIRFKGFSGEWEEIRLGDVVTCFSGGTPLVGVEEYYKGSIPFIRSAEINQASAELTISESGLKNSSAKMIEVGTVLYALYGATSGEVGRARLRGAINQAILAIIPMAKMCPEFLSQWLRKSKSSIVSTYLQGGQGNLSGDIVKNLVLMTPSFEEQTAIGNYFQRLDALINQHQQQITKLNNIKQACLKKMFV